MTTLEDIKTIAKADDSDDKKENPFEKKADDDVEEKKPVEETKADDDDKDETNKAILEALKSIVARQDRFEKAMEKPTDLPQSPKGTADSEDVGDDVSVPKDPYPQGDQAGLHDDKSGEDKPESDDGNLKMQEKKKAVIEHVTSPVERPAGGVSDVSKSKNAQQDLLPFQILQKCREKGYQNLSEVGKSLLAIDEKYQETGELI
jgi:hypothetical protein